MEGGHLTLGWTASEFLATRMGFIARSIGWCDGVDSPTGNGATKTVKILDASGRGLTYPFRSPAPMDSACDLLRELLLEDNFL